MEKNKLDDLKAAMKDGVVKLIFEKKDGTKRTAMATTKADFVPQPTTKRFVVTDIEWDKEVDGEIVDVDLPETAEVILDIADIEGLPEDEVNDIVVDELTEAKGFLINYCHVEEAPKKRHSTKDGVITFVDVDKKAWRSCNFSQVLSWEKAI